MELDATVPAAAAILQLQVEVSILLQRAEEVVVRLDHVGAPGDEHRVFHAPDRRVTLPAIEGATIEKRP